MTKTKAALVAKTDHRQEICKTKKEKKIRKNMKLS